MRKTLFCPLGCVIAFLFLIPSVFAYDVVLKNGKVVKGDLVSQDDTRIVLKDASGIRIELKKATVDLSKTEAANVPPAPAAPAKEQAAATAPADKAQDQSKKPPRVYTQQDLDRLREQEDLGEGTFAEGAAEGTEAAEKPADAKAEKDAAKKAEENQKKAEALQKRIEQTQQAYDTLTKQCDYLKTTNFQTNKITDEKGNPLPYYDTIKKVCDDAEKAKASLDQMNQELSKLQQ